MKVFTRKLPSGAKVFSPSAYLVHKIADAVWKAVRHA